MGEGNPLKEKLAEIVPHLDERQRRLLLAAEARSMGYGGISIVAKAAGASRQTIYKALQELNDPPLEGRQRKPGAGRKKLQDQQPSLVSALNELVAPLTRGDPMSPLRWTCKSTRKLTGALKRKGFSISDRTVAKLLYQEGFSLQANRKTHEGTRHPDRNAQFEFINESVKAQQAKGQPAISVDTKKKELVGNFKNAGQEWQPQGNPEKVQMHDFPIPELGRVSPYGVYDLNRNEGWVNVGIDNDTAAFAVESIRQWWKQMGKKTYPRAKTLFITADSGGSNAARSRLWKRELQQLADETRLSLTVSHFPPGTSKWNKIEHRLFSFITKNWRGRPLVSYAVVVKLIGSTRTTRGLTVRCRLDKNQYPKGLKVSNKEFAMLNVKPNAFHGDWNYCDSAPDWIHRSSAKWIHLAPRKVPLRYLRQTGVLS